MLAGGDSDVCVALSIHLLARHSINVPHFASGTFPEECACRDEHLRHSTIQLRVQRARVRHVHSTAHGKAGRRNSCRTDSLRKQRLRLRRVASGSHHTAARPEKLHHRLSAQPATSAKHEHSVTHRHGGWWGRFFVQRVRGGARQSKSRDGGGQAAHKREGSETCQLAASWKSSGEGKGVGKSGDGCPRRREQPGPHRFVRQVERRTQPAVRSWRGGAHRAAVGV